jgi:hypothetical protein
MRSAMNPHRAQSERIQRTRATQCVHCGELRLVRRSRAIAHEPLPFCFRAIILVHRKNAARVVAPLLTTSLCATARLWLRARREKSTGTVALSSGRGREPHGGQVSRTCSTHPRRLPDGSWATPASSRASSEIRIGCAGGRLQPGGAKCRSASSSASSGSVASARSNLNTSGPAATGETRRSPSRAMRPPTSPSISVVPPAALQRNVVVGASVHVPHDARARAPKHRTIGADIEQGDLCAGARAPAMRHSVRRTSARCAGLDQIHPRDGGIIQTGAAVLGRPPRSLLSCSRRDSARPPRRRTRRRAGRAPGTAGSRSGRSRR